MACSDRRAQHAIRGRGSSKCPSHQGQEVVFFCEDCDDLACVECATKLHKRHALEGLGDIIPEVKQKLHGVVNKIQETQIPMIKKEIKEIGDILSKDKQRCRNLIIKIEKQNQRLKEELDKITKQFTDLCLDMEKDNSKILQDHKTRLEAVEEELSSQLTECKDILQSGTNVQVFDYSRQLYQEFELPPQPEVQTTDFTEGKLILRQLEQLVGNFSKDTGQLTTNPRNVSWLMSSQFQVTNDYIATSMQATPDHQAMLCFSPTHSLTSVHSAGRTQTMKIDAFIQDFCFSPVTGRPWICSQSDNSVREVSGTKSSVKLRTKDKPLCICVTADENIVIGVDKGIIKYTNDGKKICEASPKGKASQVIHPRHISECPRTRNLAVVDLASLRLRGDGKPHVVILDSNLQFLSTYNGEGLDLSLQNNFCPSDAKYNDRGEIVLTSQTSVVMISGKAEYLETVYTDTEFNADFLCIQKDGSLWLFFESNNVKIFKCF